MPNCRPSVQPADRGMYFILRFTQLIVRLDGRLGVLRYKIAPKCLLPGPFGHSGVGGNPGVERTVRSYNLPFTYPCQRPAGGLGGSHRAERGQGPWGIRLRVHGVTGNRVGFPEKGLFSTSGYLGCLGRVSPGNAPV